MQSDKKSLCLHSLMCISGGFCGAYAILSRADNFASAQTGNMIGIICTLLGHNYFDFAVRTAAFLLYVAAIFLCLFLSKRTSFHMQRYAICVISAGLIFLYFIPVDIDPLIAILPLFFMMSTQWSVFHGCKEFASSTIFSTNNLKQCILAFGNYYMDGRQDLSQLRKAKYYGNSLLWYHIGVVYSFICCKHLGTHASICLLPVLGIAFALSFVKECQTTNILHKVA